jgi:pyruvate dehydrogenase E2 component (dihydrolipoamide acetyltransferase)
VIAYILEEGEDLSSVIPPGENPESKTENAKIEQTADSSITAARRLAETHNLDIEKISPLVAGGKITEAEVEAALNQTQVLGEREGFTATPAARRAARIQKIDLKQVSGTGPGGRIQRSDVDDFTPRTSEVSTQAADAGQRMPFIGMRRTIAQRLTASYQAIPHVQFRTRIDMTAFDRTRNDLNVQALARGNQKVSVTALLVKLVASAIATNPLLNSELVEEEILLHSDINIGVAVALEKGLIVPVVKNADQKDIEEISVEVEDLVSRARNEKLTGADVRGGTFTISNLGPFGVEQFNAIINPPEAAILAIGAKTQEVVVQEDGAIAVKPIMRATLSVDHRIIDGSVAAHFISDLKTALENPSL